MRIRVIHWRIEGNGLMVSGKRLRDTDMGESTTSKPYLRESNPPSLQTGIFA